MPEATGPSTLHRPFWKEVLVWCLSLCIACGVGACTEQTTPPDSGPGPGAAFYSPQGIAASERLILVANTGFHYHQGKPAYDPGFVTAIDRASRRVVATIPTTHRNPQSIVVAGQQAWVVNGGTVSLDNSGLATVVTDGGLDRLDLSKGIPRAVAESIQLGRSAEDPRIGAYGSIALSVDGDLALIGSGTRGDLFKVSLAERRVVRGPDNPIVLFPTPQGLNGLTVARPFGEGVAVLNYNTDELCLSDDLAGDLALRSCGSVGVHDDLIEGPIDLARAPDGRALVLMTIANSLYRVETNKAPFSVERAFAKTGLANNRILVHGGHAYVLNSTSNNLQRVSLSTKRSDLPFAVLPVKSNPYEMVITSEPEGDLAWITLFGLHGVAVVSLRSGEVLQIISGPASTSPGDGGIAAPDAGETADTRSCPEAGTPPVLGIQNVVQVSYGPGAGTGQEALPGVIQGGPQGGGSGGGATQGVLSLGVKGEIVVDFGDVDIVDGPGPDFIVFENPFLVSPCNPNAEPALVAVSVDSTEPASFVEFTCDLGVTKGDPDQQSWPFPGCAGVRPVQANPGGCVPADDPQLAGGDAFDLGDLGLKQARYLRIRDAGLSTMGTTTKGFDLDAVVLVNFQKR